MIHTAALLDFLCRFIHTELTNLPIGPLPTSQTRHRCFFCERAIQRADIMRFILTLRERGFRR
ncbi:MULTISPECIES: hypothetical protein [Streptomyces]|uniref:hypothetical protein n=1 Tax=Streptomyces lycopersici TaxID=2974589 RepID=UPI0021D17556|nr:hypothetical protein [Streptomyces sp. NEAU-383]